MSTYPSEWSGFIRSVAVQRERVQHPNAYPYSIPAVAALLENKLDLDPKVTILVGENGMGKSTLIEAIAVAAGFNAEGGSKNFNFATRASESSLHRAIRPVRNPRRPRTGFFLRAESYFNLATNIEELDREPGGGPKIIESHGGTSLHEQSHGESFLALIQHRFGPDGLYILDEPEAALSQKRQLVLLSRMHELAQQGSQFIVATHSPIVMALPYARIYELSEAGIERIAYEDAPNVRLLQAFLADRETFLQLLLAK